MGKYRDNSCLVGWVPVSLILFSVCLIFLFLFLFFFFSVCLFEELFVDRGPSETDTDEN